jgi:hypothetical protein
MIKSIFVLDRYHLNKAIKAAGAHIEKAEREIWRAIKHDEKEYLKIVLETIIDATETTSKIEAVKEARTYILNHWETLRHHYSTDYAGCSAEGHISHIYSELKKVSGETLDNLPALNAGRKTQLAVMLRGIRGI